MSRRGSGFVLVELLITLTVFTIVFGGVMGLIVSVQRSYTAQRSAVRAEEGLRAAQLVLGTVLRTAASDPAKEYVGLLDPDPRGNGVFDNVRVVSDFNPVDGLTNGQLEDMLVYVESDTLFVRWQSGGQPVAAAHPVDALTLDYFSSDGTALTTVTQVASATRVLVTLTAPPDLASGATQRLESWVYLRNRR